MASSNSRNVSLAGLDLEDFALSGLDAQVATLVHHPGYAALRESVWREGYAGGYAEAQKAGEAARQELLAGGLSRLQALLGELAAARASFQEQNAQELLRLALALARRILRVESAANPEVLAERLKACLRQLEKEPSYLIRVHPDRTEALSAMIAGGGDNLLGGLPFRIVGDRRVPAGSLVLEGESARIESICEDELARLEAHLMDLYAGRETGDGD